MGALAEDSPALTRAARLAESEKPRIDAGRLAGRAAETGEGLINRIGWPKPRQKGCNRQSGEMIIPYADRQPIVHRRAQTHFGQTVVVQRCCVGGVTTPCAPADSSAQTE